jgi:hypothetical protein
MNQKPSAKAAIRSLLGAALLSFGIHSATAATFSTINIAPLANDQLDQIQPGYPTGLPVILGGVPFHIEPDGPNIYNSNLDAAFGSGTVSVEIPIGLAGVTALHTLINTGWGQPGPESFASVTFTFSDATTIVHELIGGVDVRDHFGGEWTNTIGGATTNVFSTVLNGHAGLGEYRIDKQRFDLSAYSDKTLVSITLADFGGYEFQRAYLFGVTVESVPEPPSIVSAALALGALTALAYWRRAAATC